jgi:hypothetical protein
MMRVFWVFFFLAWPAAAQSWELGAGAGAGIYTAAAVTAGGRTANATIGPGVAVSAYVGQNLYRKWGGELRYTWQPGQLRLTSGAQRATFDAQSHAVHYDVLYQFGTAEDSVRPFLAFGGGAKYFRGAGQEVVFQPLGQFAFLTRTGEWQPMLSAGGGVKIKVNRRTVIRAEMRDYMTPMPTKVIAPAIGARAGGLIHDFLVLGTVSVLF